MHQMTAKAEAENYIEKHHITNDNVPEIVHSTWSEEDDNKAEKASIMKKAKAKAEAEADAEEEDDAPKNMH